MIVDDRASLRIGQVRAKARRVKSRFPQLAAITVDYIQLMQPDRWTTNTAANTTQISQGLKAMAKDLGVPVIALSQLSREVEKREDKRPKMSDLRDSGSIEQDADVILFLYRNGYYKRDAKDQRTTEIDIAKQRNGVRKVVKASFFGEHTKFRPWAPPLAEDEDDDGVPTSIQAADGFRFGPSYREATRDF